MLSRRGNEAKVLKAVLSGTLEACVTAEIISEYEQVLRRPEFKFLARDVVESVLESLSQSVRVRPSLVVTASPDSSDNRFLECAEAASAEYLVTGNKRHFPETWKNTKIVNARELLGLVPLPE